MPVKKVAMRKKKAAVKRPKRATMKKKPKGKRAPPRRDRRPSLDWVLRTKTLPKKMIDEVRMRGLVTIEGRDGKVKLSRYKKDGSLIKGAFVIGKGKRRVTAVFKSWSGFRIS